MLNTAILVNGARRYLARVNSRKLERGIYPNLAKVGVVGSNPIARSKILDLIEGSAVTTLRAGRPRCRAERMP
jgi:hypothetical protein